MKISLAGPAAFEPGQQIRSLLRSEGRALDYQFTTDPLQAVSGADIVYTDVWASMGQEEEAKARVERMRPYAVTARLFAAAKPDALFMHCLPAHPGEEVEQAVLDNPRSIIFDEAENRLHVQKAILAILSRSRGN
jgi:ornithine carbamoyltransferase